MTVAHATPSPPHDRTAHAGPEARPSVSHAVPDHPMEVSAKVLQSYVGRYFADSPTKLKISISVEEGQLNLKIAGQPKSALLPISETRFSFAGGSDSWIEFSKNTDGTVNELEIFQGESHITAHRVNRPLIQCHRVK
jgi:hypothetical protein